MVLREQGNYTATFFKKEYFFLQNYSRLEILEICAVCAIVHRGTTLLSDLFSDFVSQATPSRRSPGRPSGATRPPSLATWTSSAQRWRLRRRTTGRARNAQGHTKYALKSLQHNLKTPINYICAPFVGFS